jgi:hypothetical protein
MNKIIASVFAASVIFPALAYAQTTEAEQQAACEDDATRLCSDYIPDRAQITACMTEHYSALSPQCKAIFDEGKKKKRK